MDRQHVTEGGGIQAWTVRNPDGVLVAINVAVAETPHVERMHDHGFTVAREDLWAACTEMQRDIERRRSA